MATDDSTPAGALRPFERSADHGYVIGTPPLLVLLNAEAPPEPLAGLALARLDLLEQWLRMLSCSRADIGYDLHDVASLLLPMAEDARQIVAVLHDGLVAQERARRAGGEAQH